MRTPILFALLTAVCWGLYGPMLAQARGALASPFKPFVFIGLAYLVWGVIGGVIGMVVKGDTFTLSGPGAVWGFIAGTMGAWGALTLTLAMFTGGTAMPQVVMPVVFGGAVTVSAIYAIATDRGTSTSPWLWVGIVGIAIGIVLVAYNTPHPAPQGPSASTAVES